MTAAACRRQLGHHARGRLSLVPTESLTWRQQDYLDAPGKHAYRIIKSWCRKNGHGRLPARLTNLYHALVGVAQRRVQRGLTTHIPAAQADRLVHRLTVESQSTRALAVARRRYVNLLASIGLAKTTYGSIEIVCVSEVLAAREKHTSVPFETHKNGRQMQNSPQTAHLLPYCITRKPSGGAPRKSRAAAAVARSRGRGGQFVGQWAVGGVAASVSRATATNGLQSLNTKKAKILAETDPFAGLRGEDGKLDAKLAREHLDRLHAMELAEAEREAKRPTPEPPSAAAPKAPSSAPSAPAGWLEGFKADIMALAQATYGPPTLLPAPSRDTTLCTAAWWRKTHARRLPDMHVRYLVRARVQRRHLEAAMVQVQRDRANTRRPGARVLKLAMHMQAQGQPIAPFTALRAAALGTPYEHYDDYRLGRVNPAYVTEAHEQRSQ